MKFPIPKFPGIKFPGRNEQSNADNVSIEAGYSAEEVAYANELNSRSATPEDLHKIFTFNQLYKALRDNKMFVFGLTDQKLNFQEIIDLVKSLRADVKAGKITLNEDNIGTIPQIASITRNGGLRGAVIRIFLDKRNKV